MGIISSSNNILFFKIKYNNNEVLYFRLEGNALACSWRTRNEEEKKRSDNNRRNVDNRKNYNRLLNQIILKYVLRNGECQIWEWRYYNGIP
jgi:hypothetical protein